MRTTFNILIADDDSLSRQIIANVVRQNHVTNVMTVFNGEQAMNAVYAAHRTPMPFHIVFLDWEMPRVSGLEVLRHFRSLDLFTSTAFVMVTSVNKNAEVLQAVQAGATSYIVKPVSHDSIARKFHDICAWVRKHER